MRIKKRLFVTLFMSFTLVLLFPILVESALYHSMQSIIREDADRSNRAMMNQVSLIIDGRLLEVEQLAVQIALLPKVQLMLNRNESLRAPSAYEFKQLVDTLNLYNTPSEFIQDYYIYLREQDAIVTPEIKTDSSVFYTHFYKYEEITEDEWRGHLVQGDSASRFLPAMSVSQKPGLAAERLITYIQPLPIGGRGISKGALVILIKEQRIKELLDNLDVVHQAKILITDKNGQLLTASGTGPVFDEAVMKLDRILDNANDENKETTYEINGVEMLVTSIQSEESGWRFISLAPKSVLMEKVNRVQSWALSLLVFCLVFGLIGAFLFAKLYYTPVNKLVRSIQENRNVESDRISGEFRLIEETLLHSWSSEKQLKEALDKQTPAIQSNFLHRFMKGLTDLNEVGPESLEFMGIRFISNSFAVIMMEVDDSSKFSHLDAERQWATVRFVLTNVGQELIERHHVVYTVELDRNRLALLVNVRQDRLSEANSDIEASIEQLKTFIEQKYGIYTSIGVSEIHEGAGLEVGASYAEALMALEYRLVKGKSNVTYYREISQSELQYFYPLEIELQLMNAIRGGNFEATGQLLDHIYQMNFEKKQVSLELGKCLYFNMMSTLMKIWNSSPDRFEKEFGEHFNPVHRLAECDTLIEMHEQVKSIYKKMCESSHASKKDPGAVLVEKVAQYIAEHYAENALSLNSIADYFKLTPQYLSGLFKKHHGQNLADFMARLRVEQAKELLLEPNLTLNQVAGQIGYANDAGFIRVFKKYTGITPGRYREHARQEEQAMGGG